VISSHHLAGYVLPISLLTDLVDRYPHLVGINVSSPDLNYMTQLIDALSDKVEIHVGGIGFVPAALSLGAHGYMTSQGNLAPRVSQAVVDRFFAGDMRGMAQAFAVVLRMLVVDSRAGVSRGTKEALRQLGLPGGQVRPPRMPVTPAAAAEIAEMIERLDLRTLEELG
jgi:4-hydroxy-tetrahydrodipicolinate synthase